MRIEFCIATKKCLFLSVRKKEVACVGESVLGDQIRNVFFHASIVHFELFR